MDRIRDFLNDKDHAGDILGVLLVVFVTAAVTITPIPPADTWWQLSLGRYMSSAGTVLRENIFSYTAPNFHIIDHEWVAELVFYRIWLLGGMNLLYVFKTSVICLSFVLLYVSCRNLKVSPLASGIAVSVAALMANFMLFADIRAYIFTYLFFALYLLFAVLFFKNDSPALYSYIPILWIWSGCHAGYMLFFAITVMYLFSRLLPDGFMENPIASCKGLSLGNLFKNAFSRHKNLIILFFACSVVIFLNPYGADLVLYPFSFSHSSVFKRFLNEWAPPVLLGANLPFLIYCIFVWIAFFLFRRKVSVFAALLLASFTFLACSAVRHITLFAFVSPFVSSIAFESLYDRLPEKVRKLRTAVICALMLIAAVPAVYLMSFHDADSLSMEKSLFPYYGVEFIRLNSFSGNIGHPYGWGGYLIWKLYPYDHKNYRVFCDGRANVAYPGDVYFKSMMLDRGAENWDKYLDEYHVNTVLFSKYHANYRTDGKNIADRLVISGMWKCIFEEPSGFIFVRICPENQELLKKAAEGKLIMPDN